MRALASRMRYVTIASVNAYTPIVTKRRRDAPCLTSRVLFAAGFFSVLPWFVGSACLFVRGQRPFAVMNALASIACFVGVCLLWWRSPFQGHTAYVAYASTVLAMLLLWTAAFCGACCRARSRARDDYDAV